MREINKPKATCKNCGCPDMEERHDHLWCDWCGNEEIELMNKELIKQRIKAWKSEGGFNKWDILSELEELIEAD